MNSCLYECTVMHHRLEPVSNRFVYKLFMFYLDLDEIDELASRLLFFSRNRFNLFSFRDDDHFPGHTGPVQGRVRTYLSERGMDTSRKRITLLTNVSTLGYTFNPVSFFYVFDDQSAPIGAIAEVGNTFHEMKMFFMDRGTWSGREFRLQATKFFYVSPFAELDSQFDFQLAVPAHRLKVHIDDYRQGRRFLMSSLSGVRVPLTDTNLARYAVRFPLITLGVIGRIHWQALKLFLKKAPFYRKTDFPEMQREVLHGRRARFGHYSSSR